MPFISDREERAELQNATYDDGSVHADYSETFQAAVGFAIDEGLSTSRMLNNEMYDQRRIKAKEIFDSGVSREDYMDELGRVDYNAMSRKYEGIKTESELFKQKKEILDYRRKYYNDVMRRSDSTAGNVLGSMTGFMADPINLATMAVATPLAAAKGVGVLGRVLYGGAGAASVNLATEALIQPFVLDYKLDIGSPYGAEDAITNLAMAAGGGFLFGGSISGISGWLSKIRKDVDKAKITPEMNIKEIKVAAAQVDELIETLKPATFDNYNTRVAAADNIRAALKEAGDTATLSKMKQGRIPKDIVERIDAEEVRLAAEVKISKAEAVKQYPGVFDATEFRAKIISDTKKELGVDKLADAVMKKIDERVNNKKIEAEAAYLRGMEEERTKMNSRPRDTEPRKVDDISDQQLDEVFRAIENPKVVVDGKFTDAGKIISKIDDDIEAIEAIRICSLG